MGINFYFSSMRHIILFCLLFVSSFVHAQNYTVAKVFAHNDYVREKPFYTAYDLGVGYIEADVFLLNNELMVAHHKREISAGRTLDTLYLKPLHEMVKMNRGYAYRDPKQKLTIMIDLKTEGIPTLNAIVTQLNKYPLLTRCPTLQFMISGSVPDPAKWKTYPDFIFFDGRPGIRYTEEQLKRVSMISTGFGSQSRWAGKGKIPEDDLLKISALVEKAHSKGKPFRFWGTPDFPMAWRELMALNMDVIVTDKVQALVDFVKKEEK